MTTSLEDAKQPDVSCHVCGAQLIPAPQPTHCLGCRHDESECDECDAALERAAQAAASAQLPAHFQWGHDATEQFEFGKERAADAIRALKRGGT